MAKSYRLRPCQVREMSIDERAWVGAMIEAEGSVGKPYGQYRQWRITVVNTDPEILSALLRATGVGIVGLKTRAKQWQRKPCFGWSVQAQLDVAGIVNQCAPYSMKLQQVGV